MPPGPASPPLPAHAAFALGSNLGDRAATIARAADALARLPGTRVLRISEAVQTAPVGGVPQGPYLNAAVTLTTTLSPHDLLTHALDIERSLGRDRASGTRWGPRTIDLDLLLYADLILHEPHLTIPHPRLHERAFVLVPLAQIAADWTVPTLGRTVAELLRALPTPALDETSL